MAVAGMEEPAEYDIVVQKGSIFELPFVIQNDSGPVDLTGFSFKAQLLDAPEGTALFTFDVVAVALTAGAVKLYAAASTTGLIGTAVTGTGYKNAVQPMKFYPGFYDFFASPSASTGTNDKCYLRGVAKIYPRGTKRP